jgi:hypothetical protein
VRIKESVVFTQSIEIKLVWASRRTLWLKVLKAKMSVSASLMELFGKQETDLRASVCVCEQKASMLGKRKEFSNWRREVCVLERQDLP